MGDSTLMADANEIGKLGHVRPTLLRVPFEYDGTDDEYREDISPGDYSHEDGYIGWSSRAPNEEERAGPLFGWALDYCTSGDYVGGYLEESNRRALESILEGWNEDEDTPHFRWARMSWDFNGEGIFIFANQEIPAEVLEVLQSLEDYPVIDEDLMSEVEREYEQEHWEHTGRDDFRSDLEKIAGDHVDMEYVTDETLDDVMWGLISSGSVTSEADGPGWHMRWDDLLGSWGPSDVLKLKGAKLDSTLFTLVGLTEGLIEILESPEVREALESAQPTVRTEREALMAEVIELVGWCSSIK